MQETCVRSFQPLCGCSACSWVGQTVTAGAPGQQARSINPFFPRRPQPGGVDMITPCPPPLRRPPPTPVGVLLGATFGGGRPPTPMSNNAGGVLGVHTSLPACATGLDFGLPCGATFAPYPPPPRPSTLTASWAHLPLLPPLKAEPGVGRHDLAPVPTHARKRPHRPPPHFQRCSGGAASPPIRERSSVGQR